MSNIDRHVALMLFSLAAIISGYAVSAVKAVNYLEAATTEQCANHDWPADKHQIHMDFCLEYGYPTN